MKEDLSPGDVFEDYELIEYAVQNLDMIHVDDLRDAAQDLGLIDPEDLDPFETVPEGFEVVSSRDIDYAHDTQGHTGAVQWCSEGSCGLVQ